MPTPTAKELYDLEARRIDRCQKPITVAIDASKLSNSAGTIALALQLPHALNRAAYCIAVHLESQVAQLAQINANLIKIGNALDGIKNSSIP